MKKRKIYRDPRFEGSRLNIKGIVIFIGAFAVLFFSSLFYEGATPILIKIIFTPIAFVGFLIALAGMVKHYKIFFGPTDIKREVDPGYDFEYLLCPHCKKAKMRMQSAVIKCPVCKKKTRI